MTRNVEAPEASTQQTPRLVVTLIGAGIALMLAVGVVALTTAPLAWLSLGAAGAVFAWLLTGTAPVRLRPWIAVAMTIGVWRAWSAFAPNGGALELLGPMCAAIPIIFVPAAFMFGFATTAQTRKVAGVGTVVVLAIACSGSIDLATVRVRVAVHRSEIDRDARRLLERNETAAFDGIASPQHYGPSPLEARQGDPVTSIGGLPVLYGSVSAKEGVVRYCLKDDDWHIACQEELLYVAAQEVDGAVEIRSVDCDYVTRWLSGSWYIRRVECPRM